MTTPRWLSFPVSALVLLTTACGDPLLERQTITRMRVLGARYEPDADAGRASPIQGEAGRIRWLVVGPEGPLEVGFELFACPSQPRLHGVPACGAPPFAESRGREREPTLEVHVPDITRLLVGGNFCSIGEAAPHQHPTPALEEGGCLAPDAEQELASYELDVLDGNAAENDPRQNRHPDLDGAELRVNDLDWPPDATPCIRRGEIGQVRLALPLSVREVRDDSSGVLETIQVSHLSTRGRFARPFTVFDRDATELDLTVVWQAPDEPGATHVYFVARDLRGGVSWLTRSLCVE